MQRGKRTSNAVWLGGLNGSITKTSNIENIFCVIKARNIKSCINWHKKFIGEIQKILQLPR